MRKKLSKLLAVAMAALILVACESGSVEAPGASDEAQVETQTENPETGETQVSNVTVNVQSGITDAVDKVGGAVVSVINMQRVNYSDYFGFPFGVPSDAEEEESELLQAGTGSGVVYKVDGDLAYIVTNNHVVEGSDRVEVLFDNGDQVEADLIGADPWTDLAVLEVSSESVSTVAEFGDSDALTVGEPAIAIGSPLGTEYASSVTSGIISGIERPVPVDLNSDGTADWQMTAIQTDAAINPGNSGGALVNILGQVIGINSMKISSSQVEGMGFAIPSNEVVQIINELEANGEVVRPVLGISQVDLSLISDEDRATLRIPQELTDGVLVYAVSSGSTAEEAGLQAGDVIVEFNGQEITDSISMRRAIYSSEVGDQVNIKFYRNGELYETEAELSGSVDLS